MPINSQIVNFIYVPTVLGGGHPKDWVRLNPSLGVAGGITKKLGGKWEGGNRMYHQKVESRS